MFARGERFVNRLGVKPRGTRPAQAVERLFIKFQQWAFGRIVELVSYKIEEHGMYVDHVPSPYTSQECSRCGYVSKGNLNGKQLCCGSCGRKVHRDYDAGVSIAVKYVRLHSGQTYSNGGVSVNAALKSGTPDSSDNAIQALSFVH
ncbi:MAG: transposase [Haloquadratum sp. J07HQX50]|jgi:Transposase and inactivated derivatives|nr:MAG: transposase [Haloquadratum sp. J07HQX50]